MGKYFCAKCKFFDDDVGFYRLVNFNIVSRVLKFLLTLNFFVLLGFKEAVPL